MSVSVRVEPVTPEWADALGDGDDEFARRFGVTVEPDWLGFPEARPYLLEYAHGDGPPEWGPHLIFDSDGALVGNGGWKGSPVDGAAELGYAVAPSRQGRGIASAVVRELIDRARAWGLRIAVAHTLAEESASTSVLRRSGFVRVGELVDDEEGPLWRWERHLEPSGTQPL
jgi:[ribosomal protein S5]-alanine N-acetyltransferase